MCSLATVAPLTMSSTTPAATAFSGSGSCLRGYCNFCTGVNLYPYGTTSSSYGDRCAYGYFFGATTVVNEHSSGSLALCAGMKTATNGSGANAGFGVTCATGGKFVAASGAATAGYATIVNWDNAYHSQFVGRVVY